MSTEDELQQPMPVFECWNDWEAEIIIGLLRSHGIEARANSDVPHSVLPITADGLGKVQVLVQAGDAGLAHSLITEYETSRSTDIQENAEG